MPIAAISFGRVTRAHAITPPLLGVTWGVYRPMGLTPSRPAVVEDAPRPSAVTTACDQVGGFTSLSSRSSGLVTSPIALTATRA
jgi:hypothetical protein